MANMIKMELYRFFHSLSTWGMWFADMALAFLSVVVVYATKGGGLAPVYSNVGELLAAQVNGGIWMMLCTGAVVVFSGAKYKEGFIKNIANQLPGRGMLAFLEVMVAAVVCSWHALVYAVSMVVAGGIFFGTAFIAGSASALMKLLVVQFVLHWGFGCLLLLLYRLSGSIVFAIAGGLLMAFKVLRVFYVLAKRFMCLDVSPYMLDTNVFQIGMGSAKAIYMRGVVVGLAFVFVETGLLYLVMHKKDV